MLYISNCKISVKNCTFTNAKFSGILLYGELSGFTAFENNNIINCGENQADAYPIRVYSSLASLAGIGSGNSITTAKGIGITGGGTVKQDMTLKTIAQYIIKSNPTVNNNATLTIESGVTLKFDAKSLTVNGGGKIIAKGTPGNKITFTCAKEGSNRKAGDWQGIEISSEGSEFENCVFEYGGGYSASYGMLHVENCKISVKNCTFSNAKYSGILLYGSSSGFEAFDNNTISNCGEEQTDAYPIRIYSNIMSLAGMGSGNNIVSAKGIGICGSTVDKSITLKKFLYTIYGNISVRSASGAAILTVEPGAKLMFAQNKSLEVNGGGKLIAQGTTSNKIIFTGTVAQKGYWNYVGFDGSNVLDGSILENCEISYGGAYASYDGNIYCYGTSGSQVTIRNCEITNSKGYGIFFYGTATAILSGNTFSNNNKADTNK